MQPQLRPYSMATDDLVGIGVLAFFVLLTFVLYRSRMIIAYKLTTFFSSRQIYATNEISTSNQEFVDMLLLIFVGCISVASIFYLDSLPVAPTTSHYGSLLLMLLAVMLLVAFKTVIYSLINWTFFKFDKGQAWLSSFFFSLAIVSALSFPLAVLKVYVPGNILNVTHCLLFIILLQKILLLCKLIANFRPKRYGCLLFFLYFCSVELMPTLVVWHILRNFNVA